MLTQILIHECALYKALAVIEHYIYLNGCDVASESGELTFLNRTDLTFWIKYVDMDAVHAEKSVGNGRASVTAGGDENVYGACVGAFFYEVLEQSCHKACSDILKGKSRAVEEFETIYVGIYFCYRAVK